MALARRWAGGGLASCVLIATSCNVVLGLDQYVEVTCPGDPRCPPPIMSAPTCTDGVQNGNETDIDCGGPDCPACKPGDKCMAASDCATNGCVSGLCVADTCTDGAQDNGETDVDCGGSETPMCPRCADNKMCQAQSDCLNGFCNTSVTPAVCATPSCSDKIKDGTETDVDCGGKCSPCPDNKACLVGTDCQSGVCMGTRCAPNEIWSTSFGLNDALTTSDITAVRVAVDKSNNVYAPGTFTSSVKIQNDTVTGGGAFYPQFSASGTYASAATRFMVGAGVALAGVAADPSGNLYALAVFSGNSVKLNNGTCQFSAPANQWGQALIKLDSSGKLVSCNQFNSSGRISFHQIATDTSGNVLMLGSGVGVNSTTPSTIDFGTAGSWSSTQGLSFVVKMKPDGTYAWVTSLGGSDTDVPGHLVTDAFDNVFVSGEFTGTLTLPAGFTTTTLTAPMNGTSGFYAKLSPSSGVANLAKSFGTSVTDTELAPDQATGDIYVTGGFGGTLSFGANTLMSASNSANVFLARLDSAGNAKWAKSFGMAGHQASTDIALDSSGRPVIVGNYQGTVDFGGGALVNPTGLDRVFVAKLDGNGGHLWSQKYGDRKAPPTTFLDFDAHAAGVAIDSDGNALIEGEFTEAIDFGGTPLTVTIGSKAVFLAKLRLP